MRRTTNQDHPAKVRGRNLPAPPARRVSDMPGLTNEQAFGLLMSHAQELIALLDASGNVLFVSPSHQEVLGFKPHELVGVSLADIVHPDDMEVVSRAIQKSLTAGKSPLTTARVQHQKGHYVVLEGSASSIKDEAGNPQFILSVSRDITDRLKAEEELRLYREIVASAKDAIGIIGLDGFYLEQNEAHRRLLGYEDQELAKLTPAVHMGESFVGIMAGLQEVGSWRGIVRCSTKNGRKLDVDLTAFTVKDRHGQPACYVGIKRNISGIVQNEQRLKEANERITKILESLLQDPQ